MRKFSELESASFKEYVLGIYTRQSKGSRSRIVKLLDLIRSERSHDLSSTSNPGELKREIDKTSEAALQRAILFSKNDSTLVSSTGSTIKVRWHDMELPVVYNASGRRQCVDLVGFTVPGDKPVLCELKFKDGGANTVIEGMVELLVYSYWLSRNAEDHQRLGIGHKGKDTRQINWMSFAGSLKPVLVLAADHEFWDKIVARRNEARYKLLFDFRDRINKLLGLDIQFFSIDIPSDLFSSQKGVAAKYTPYLPASKAEQPWTEMAKPLEEMVR